jgi:signal peptidase II
MKGSGWILTLALLIATVGCDRVTKQLAVAHLAGAPAQSYLQNTIRLEYAENKGAFLSLGAGLPDGIRTAVLTVGVSVLLITIAILAVRRRWAGVPLAGVALMWAGGASNLIDRASSGRVVDFLNVGVGSLRTGIFNVADVAVMLGAVLIVAGDLRPEWSLRRPVKNSSSAP